MNPSNTSEKTISFFAFQFPLKDKFKMQMAMVESEKDNVTHPETIWYDFTEERVHTQVPELENLRFYSVCLPISTFQSDKEEYKIIQENETTRRIGGYKIRISCDNRIDGRSNTYRYYEESRGLRKTLRSPTTFIFNISILKEDVALIFKEAPCKNVQSVWEQTLYFVICLIETGRLDQLKDFISYHQKRVAPGNELKQADRQKFLELLYKYFENKQILSTRDFNVLLPIICLFGLIPEQEALFIKMAPIQFIKLLNVCEARAEQIFELKSGTPIFDAFQRGLSLLFLLEESKTGSSALAVNLLRRLDSDKEFTNTLIQGLMSRTAQLDWRMRYSNVKEIFNFAGPNLPLYGFCSILMPLSHSLSDLGKISKEFITARCNEVASNNPDPAIMDKAIKDAKDQISYLFARYLEKNPNWKSELTLETLAGFLKEISEEKDYLEDIFAKKKEFCEGLHNFLVRTKFYDESSLDWLSKILDGYFSQELLPDIYLPGFVLNIVRVKSQNTQDFNYYVKFFYLFMTHPSLTFSVFEEMLAHWIRNIDNKKNLIVYLDQLSGLFRMNFEVPLKKKKKFIETIIACIDLNNLEESIEAVIKNIKLQDALDCFLQKVTKEIDARYLDSLQTKTIENPLLIFQKLLGTYPKNSLLTQLVEYCLTKMPVLDREFILMNLFKNPDTSSLISMILTEDVFREYNIYRQVVDICCDVVNDLKTCNLEFKWVSGVPEKKLEITYQLLTPIVAIVSERNGERLPAIKTIIKEYKDNWKAKLSKIESIEIFINTYCKEAGDAPKLLGILEKVKKNSYESKLNELISPADLDVFEPYVSKLSRFYNSESFKAFKINNQERGRPLKCIDEAKRALTQLEKFKTQVTDMLKDDKVLVNQLSTLFSSVKDIRAEVEILQILWDLEFSQKLFEKLKFIKNLEVTKRICTAINLCIEIFNLTCDRQRAIEEGINLSIEQTLTTFYSTNKVIDLYLQFQEKEPLYQMLNQFGDAQKLLEFTIARTDKLEIDYMVQAVNAYDLTHVTTQTIFDFVNFWKFITDLNNAAKGKTLFGFFDGARSLLQNEVYADVLTKLEASKTNFYGIQNLYLELAHKEEAKRQQIFRILEKAIVKKITQNKKKFDIELESVTERAGEKISRIIKFADLLELRDRARLIVYTEQRKIDNQEIEVNNQEDELEKINLFCSRVDVVEQLLKVLNQLVVYGSPEFSVGVNETPLNANFNIEEDGNDQLSKFKDRCVSIFEELKSSIDTACEKYYELTYLKGRDFWDVEYALKNKKCNAIIQGLNILSFIGKEHDNYPLNTSESIEARLDKIGLALSSLRDNPRQQKPEQQNIDVTFAIIEVNEKAIIRGLITLYSTFEKAIPIANQLLVCHSSTSSNELTAFALRCFYSPEEALFCLIQPERLSFALQSHFSSVIKSCQYKQPSKKFHLGFVTTNKQINLIAALKLKGPAQSSTQNLIRVFRNDELIKESALIDILQNNTKNCTIITSEFTGLGKSSFIQKYARENGLGIFKLPISGSIKPSKIGKKLIHPLLLQQSVLWLSIGSIDEQEKALLNEILFSLIVLRCFHDSKNIAVLHKDVTIFIEMDSSYFENLINDIEVLGYLQVKDFEKMNWDIFDYCSEKTQFVCHYIKMIEDESLGTIDVIEKKNKKDEKDTNNIKYTEDTILGNDICQKILKDLLMKMQDTDRLSYTQLNIFIDILYSLFKSFSESGFFMFSVLSKQGEASQKTDSVVRKAAADIFLAIKYTFLKDSQISEMRLSLARALITTADQFTSKAVQNIERDSINEQERLELIEKATSWKDFKPFIVVFTFDKTPIFIYKSPNDIPSSISGAIIHHMKSLKDTPFKPTKEFLIDYQKCDEIELFDRLVQLTKTDHFRTVCFKCFCKYDSRQPENLDKSQEKSQVRPCPVCQKAKDDKSFDKKFRKQNGFNQYALTPDNFIKMVLIYIKAKQMIPVIIMGETGCGKTSLIRHLCTNILDDEFESFSIHAGINHSAILKKMTEFITIANELNEKGKRLWVFFDEFNTTSSIGLIKEIICERTMLGDEIPDNMVFLGACNPWRLRPESLHFDNNVGLTKKKLSQANHKSNLLYTVHPLPETMVNYIWDYGFLDRDTEKRYIYAMFSNLTLGENPDLKYIMVELVSASHEKLRDTEDASSVSLRDCTRYKNLFRWFSKSIIKRNTIDGYPEDLKTPYRQAAILAMVHCYYLRISSQKSRQSFLQGLEPYTKSIMTTKEIEKLVEDQEKDFLRRMKPLPNGIALNKALRENVFALIVCILTKTPIFICGKPGCSKSLAIQLVFTHLRGANSKDEYFRSLPELIPVPYQGSEYCTSDSILSIFDKANKLFDVTVTNKILPVIVFDEIGLAENSENNPLKVLHSKLEIEDIKVGFIGVSNWRLDASKMNRALYLARVDPDFGDLVATAEEISQSICRNTDVTLPKNIIEAITTIYMALKDLKDENKKKQKENTFGLRDYYFTIKGISRDLVDMKKEDASQENNLYFIVRKSLKMNFSGLTNEYEFLWKRFCQEIGKIEKENQIPEVSVQDLILNNLRKKEGRYLMLITENDCVSEYIEQLIKQNLQRGASGPNSEKNFEAIRTLAGSQMVDDLKNESYGYRLLSDIILYMEKAYALIFRKLDHLYSSLYDLFNQNFSDQGGSSRKYCKIALGVLYNANCYVHHNFHCIIFINEAEMKKADPPFLSRFEKFRLLAEDFLSPNEKIIHNRLIIWINSIVASNEGDNTKPEFVFMNYTPEYPFSLIIRAKNELTANKEKDIEDKILEICKQKLINIASFDFAILVSLNIHDPEEKKNLLKKYYTSKIHVFKKFMTNLYEQKEKNSQNVVYTYSQISEDITCCDKSFFKELKLGNFKSEAELQEEIKRWLNSQNTILIVRVDLITEGQHLLFLKHLLVNAASTKKRKGLHLVIMVHLQRFNVGDKNIAIDTVFQDWEPVMIDRLNEDYVIPDKYSEVPRFKELKDLDLLPPLGEVIAGLFDRCLSKMRYTANSENQERVNQRRKEILNDLKNGSSEFLRLIGDCVLKMIAKEKNNERFEDWRKYISDNLWIRAKAASSLDAIKTAMSEYYESYLMRVIHVLERDYLLDSYLQAVRTSDEPQNRLIMEIWGECFQRIDIEVFEEQVKEVDFVFGLHFPFSRYEQEKIKQIQEEAQDLKKELDVQLKYRMSLDKLMESSFFGSAFSEDIWNNKELFEEYFKDQLLLYLRSNKLKLSIDIAFSVLDCMFFNHELAFKYFLSESKSLRLLLGAVEAVTTLQEGEGMLKRCLKAVYNLEDNSPINTENLSSRVLVYKNNKYYNMGQTRFKDLMDRKVKLDDLKPDISDSPHQPYQPFLYFLFESIIGEISSCLYLKKCKFVEIKSSFKLIEDKISRTRIIPWNIGLFKPWIDVIQFIENCDKYPAHRFNELVDSLTQYEAKYKKEGFFSQSEAIDHIIDYLKKCTAWPEDLENIEKHNNTQKLQKLHSQLYKNLVDCRDEFPKALEVIDKYPAFWKSSAKIIHWIDKFTGFSAAIKSSEGKIDQDIKKNKRLKTLADMIVDLSPRIHKILVNKGFMMLVKDWWYHPHKKQPEPEKVGKFLKDKYDAFISNLNNFQSLSKGKKTLAFLGVIVWLKIYLYIYSLALEYNSSEIPDIDGAIEGESPELSTLKLYVLKDLKLRHNKTLGQLRDDYKSSTIRWIKSLLKEESQSNKNNANINLPACFDKRTEESRKLDDIYELKSEDRMENFGKFCKVSRNSYSQTLSIYLWFIKYYLKYLNENYTPETHFIKIIEQHKGSLSKYLGDLGYNFIHLLVTNFVEGSFFRLVPNAKTEEIHQKLAALGVLASFLSQQFIQTTFSSIIFEKQRFQKELAAHIATRHLYGQIQNNPIINHMKDVKKNVERRLKQSSVSQKIYKCSTKCDYYFLPDEDGNFSPTKNCPLCTKEIKVELLNTKNSQIKHIKLPFEEGIKEINQYIKESEEKIKEGYHYNAPEQSNKNDTKPHLTPITFRTLHFFLHTVLFGLAEAGFIPETELDSIVGPENPRRGREYFKKHFTKDYNMLNEITKPRECYIWVYKIITDLNKIVEEKMPLTTLKAVKHFEEYFERQVDIGLSSFSSVDPDNQQIEPSFVNYREQDNILNYLDELEENTDKYPNLEFFNYMEFPTFKDFENQFLFMTSNSQGFPLLSFALQNHKALANIPSLAPIVRFTNKLRREYNYRISREDAEKSKMKTVFSHNPSLPPEFDEFKSHWNKLKLETIEVENHLRRFQFIDADSRLSMFLPDMQKPDSNGIVVIGVMRALASVQNDMVYLTKASHGSSSKSLKDIIEEEKDSMELVQTAQIEDLIDINLGRIMDCVFKNGYIHNCDRNGPQKRTEIIYDFEEIESMIFQEVNKKKVFNTEKFIEICYAFEPHPEKNSTISDIRRKNTQVPIPLKEKNDLNSFLKNDMDKNYKKRDLVNCLGSLDYIFTYLRNVKVDRKQTIGDFCEKWISNSQYLSEDIKKEQLSKIPIEQIVDLYETIEEHVFDEAFREGNHTKFGGETNAREQVEITDHFDRATLQSSHANICPQLKDPNILAKVMKRIILRGLVSPSNLDASLQSCFATPDLWSEGVDITYVNKINLHDSIKLKHCYIILEYLETIIMRDHSYNPMHISDDQYSDDIIEYDHHALSEGDESDTELKRSQAGPRRRPSDSD